MLWHYILNITENPTGNGVGVSVRCKVAGILLHIYRPLIMLSKSDSIMEVFGEVAEDLKERIKVGGKWIKALSFIYGQLMIARSQGGLQAMMHRLNTVSISQRNMECK